jgi:hypothetical protein
MYCDYGRGLVSRFVYMHLSLGVVFVMDDLSFFGCLNLVYVF